MAKNEIACDKMMYGSAYLAEFYDLHWEGYFASTSDTKIYLDILKNCSRGRLSATPGADPMIVLDVGTGTGRILKAISAGAAKDGLDLSNVELIGLDLSQSMLDRAAQTWNMPGVGKVSWVLGSALDLKSALASQAAKYLDFLVFGFGSISHLERVEDLEQFFRQVSIVLRPVSGHAAISMMDFAKLGNQDEQPLTPPDMSELQSKQFPGIVYQAKTESYDVVDSCFISRMRVFVSRVDGDNQRQQLEDFVAGLKLRMWQESEVRAAIDAAGLRVLDVNKHMGEIIFILQVPE